jgi:hypothetical protein
MFIQLLCVVLTIYFIYLLSFLKFFEKDKLKINQKVPKIIHLIYFPWDKNQKLKEDVNDFDHTYYSKLVNKYPDFEIKLWNMEKMKFFFNEHYPDVLKLSFEHMRRPIQLVDLYRYIVVYHYGGIYIQYGSEICTNIYNIFPSSNKEVCLYTENVWLFDLIRFIISKKHKIRNGKIEERIRVMTQIFSAIPKSKYMELT